MNTADGLRTTIAVDVVEPAGARSVAARIQSNLPGDETSYIIIEDIIKFY